MKNVLPKRFGIIQKVIIVLAIIMMSIVWPLGTFPVSHVSTCEWDGVRMSGPSNENGFVRQTFSPNFEKMKSISVYVVNDPEYVDTMKAVLRVYNHHGVIMSETYFQVEDYELPGYITIPVDLEFTMGYLYYYTIAGVDGDLMVAYSNDDSKTAENGEFFYKEIPSGGTSIVTEYEYERPMGYKRILFWDGLIVAVAFAFIALVGVAKNTVFKKCNEEKATFLWGRTERIVKYSVVGVLAAGVVTAFIGIVVKRLFTDDVLNIIVLFVGVIIAVAYVCYGALTCKSEMEPLEEGEDTLEVKAVSIIRALLFAAAIIMCCLYVDGYTNYHKGLETRKVLVFFGLFMWSLGNRKQIINIPNAVWSVIAVLIGKYYIFLNSDHLEHMTTATNSAWVIWVIGLLIIQLVVRLIHGEWKQLKKISIPCVVLVAVFFVGCVIFANGRGWTGMLAVVFALWILFYAMSYNKEKILEVICNGILLAFVGTVIFCLYRRPYQYYMLTRYAGVFFTATTTATFYMVPAAAALTKTFLARKENNKNKEILGWVMYGIVAAYLSFTASRTGIVSMIVMTAFALCMPLAGEKKGFVKRQLKQAGIMVMAVILAFITCFSATRMLPAMAGNPFYFPYESSNAFISEDTPWEGGETEAETYITIQKTLSMLFGRLFTASGDERDKSVVDIGNQDEGYILGPLLASTTMISGLDAENTSGKYANGRLDIYKLYLSHLNMTGHENMILEAENGDTVLHAHSSYIQVAYDFGIPVGVIFLFVCLLMFIKSGKKAYTQGKDSVYACLPFIIIVGFGVASVFEWIYHPCNPAGFAFLVMIAPLMLKEKAEASILEK